MDTIDNQMQDFEEQLQSIIRRYRDNRLGSARGDPGDIETLLQTYEARITALIRQHERRSQVMLNDIWRDSSPERHRSPSQTPSPPPHITPPFFAERVVLDGTPMLKRLDTFFLDEFQIDRYFPHHSWRDLPTVYCETLEEFFQPYVEVLDVSDETRREILQSLVDKAQKQAQKGQGTWGIFWPGRGCYINGWLFAYKRMMKPREALHHPDILPSILATTAHEKLGHGFISEFTALGQEKVRLGTWRYDAARRFDLRVVDTPEGTLLAEKEAILYASSQLLEEGWATWVEHHVMKSLARQPWAKRYTFPQVAESRYTTSELWQALNQAFSKSRNSQERVHIQSIMEAVRTIFVAQHASITDLHRAVLTIHSRARYVDPLVAPSLGQPLRYVIGYLLVRDLAARLGPLCVPYAIVIAANVSYNLDSIAAADLQRIVAQDVRLNVDSRLVQMRLLTLQTKNDVRELIVQAHQELNMAIPKALRA